MKIDLDEMTLAPLNQMEERIALLSGVKPRSTSILAQALLQWACENMPESDLKGLAPKTLSLAQRRKLLMSEMRTITGQVDAPKLDKLMRTLNRLKQPEGKESEKETVNETAVVD